MKYLAFLLFLSASLLCASERLPSPKSIAYHLDIEIESYVEAIQNQELKRAKIIGAEIRKLLAVIVGNPSVLTRYEQSVRNQTGKEVKENIAEGQANLYATILSALPAAAVERAAYILDLDQTHLTTTLVILVYVLCWSKLNSWFYKDNIKELEEVGFMTKEGLLSFQKHDWSFADLNRQSATFVNTPFAVETLKHLREKLEKRFTVLPKESVKLLFQILQWSMPEHTYDCIAALKPRAAHPGTP